MTYSEKLKDPRWQKKRLEILHRDDFRCVSCTCNHDTLHVHHLCYVPNTPPWGYDNDDLITLCESCHEAWHYLFDQTTIDHCIIAFTAKLWDKIQSDKINKWLKENG